jgi:arylsulfatase A-like enzyme
MYATGSWTLSSHASLFTGRLPRQLGLAQPPAGTAHSVRPAWERISSRILPEVLRKAGYATHGLSANLWVSAAVGFDIGFDSFEYLPGRRTRRLDALTAGGSRARLAWALEGLAANSDDGAGQIGARLRSSIDAWSGRPTFWFVNLVECHSPYLPPRPFNDLGLVDRLRAAEDARRYLSFEAICLIVAGAAEIPPDSLERMRHLYARAVNYADDWVGGILEALDARGILDQTLVIITSDHGENFGEGGLIAHGFSLDERLIHVPFLSAGPGGIADQEVMSLAQVPGRIAAACGVNAHPLTDTGQPAGIALAQYDPMAGPEDVRVRRFTERRKLDPQAIARLTPRLTAAVDGRYKLLIRDRVEAVYDLLEDPAELSPLDAGQLPESVAKLRAAARTADAPGSEEGRSPGAAAPPSEAELAALERQMKLLGYM